MRGHALRRILLLGALVVAACTETTTARLAAPEGVADDDPRVVACRQEARRTPALREINRRRGRGLSQQDLAREETETAVNVAYHACLQEAGITVAGGVEPVRRPVWRWNIPGAPLPAEPTTTVPLGPPPATTGY
jgi:hypothetical protein